MENTKLDQNVLNHFIKYANDKGASDIIISSGSRPAIKLHGELVLIENARKLDFEECKNCFQSMMDEKRAEEFEKDWQVDFSYETEDGIRVRTNIYNQLKGISASFRIIKSRVKNLETLGLPPQLSQIKNLNNGLVLIAGSMGQGKSTTLSALINEINKNQKKHIITIEDPIEMVHKNDLSIIDQREVGIHTKTFHEAMSSALRENADVIMLGELRDYDTMKLALTAAETGSLVLATLHTNTVVSTIDRIIHVFPSDQQNEVRYILADALRFVLWQQLLPSTDEEGHRVLSAEFMINNSAVSHAIRDRETHQIYNAIELGIDEGMLTMQQSLEDLLAAGKITQDTFNRNAREE